MTSTAVNYRLNPSTTAALPPQTTTSTTRLQLPPRTPSHPGLKHRLLPQPQLPPLPPPSSLYTASNRLTAQPPTAASTTHHWKYAPPQDSPDHPSPDTRTETPLTPSPI
ncbi:hypothetical protein LENED_009384 [Lentinula edodes]|uniref:Uncharacterized protein n=1 Tax=Lentinula edodes TaxID=5353 RepID=A0A1Q3EJM1_LENED|nr:hypothetical protein LENED_009384 [Lentinula edodes]